MVNQFSSGSLAVVRARSIINELGLREPSEIDIEAIAALRGVYVREDVLDGCDGRLLRKGNLGLICVKANTQEIGRKRFTIAHELGHFELHDKVDRSILCLEKDIQSGPKQADPIETDANNFATELLLPEIMFKPRCEQDNVSLSFIGKLAQEFKTSLTATALRFIDFTPHRCAIVFSDRRSIQWCKWTDDFGYLIQKGTSLDPDSFAFDLFHGGQVPNEMMPVPASAWIQGRRLRASALVKEQSWRIYDCALTLIWVDDEFDLEEDDVCDTEQD